MSIDPLSGVLIEQRLRELASFTEKPPEMTRLSLTAVHRASVDHLTNLFVAAGMTTEIDPLGCLVGRYAPDGAGPRTLMIGSHIDTVRNAGIYDGNLGVILGLSLIETLHRDKASLPFAIELIAFSDEEGVRFPSTLTASKSMAGRYDPKWLEECDAKGVSRREALEGFGAPATDPNSMARDPAKIVGYVEAHIEQGPVLEAQGLPLGIVTAINGVTRGQVVVRGMAGHAGTLPMAMRRDALTAAAEMMLAIETRAREEADLVGTVGIVEVPHSAINVVPGETRFTFDVRSPSDEARRHAVVDIERAIKAIAAQRGVEVTFEVRHRAPATTCDAALSDLLEKAAQDVATAPIRLPSGAGHDAMSFRNVLPGAMLFVRCKGGISHNPAEYASPEDMELAARALRRFVMRLAAR